MQQNGKIGSPILRSSSFGGPFETVVSKPKNKKITRSQSADIEQLEDEDGSDFDRIKQWLSETKPPIEDHHLTNQSFEQQGTTRREDGIVRNNSQSKVSRQAQRATQIDQPTHAFNEFGSVLYHPDFVNWDNCAAKEDETVSTEVTPPRPLLAVLEGAHESLSRFLEKSVGGMC
jgi:hypothetical protein